MLLLARCLLVHAPPGAANKEFKEVLETVFGKKQVLVPDLAVKHCIGIYIVYYIYSIIYIYIICIQYLYTHI